MKLKNKVKSVKGKVFLYMSLFTAIMLVFLWAFQTVFLDSFYKEIKTEQIKETTTDIKNVITSNDFNVTSMQSYIDDVVSDTDYCIRIFDETGTQIYENVDNRGTCGLSISTPDEITALYKEAYKNGGEAVSTYDQDTAPDKAIIRENKEGKKELEIPINKAKFQSMTYSKIVNDNDGNVYFVLVNAKITLVGEVVDTLRTQLLIISIILIAIAIIVSSFIAKRISKPITETNEAAKELAKGNLAVEFKGKGYIEIEELNDTLNYASAELSKVDKLRNELIANVSHDFRTPLTMIAGYSEIIRDLPNENTPENIQVIIDECNRLNRLVNELLDLSKLQSGNEIIEKEDIDISELTKSIVSRFNTMMKPQGYKVIFEGEDGVFVESDDIKLNQVIYNIVGNAIHYTGEDKTVIVKEIVKGDIVRIEITDSGKGIKKEDIPYVWDRYYKEKKVHKRQEVGTGIGLSIVKGILELHKATYGIISEKGKGTTFYFELPIKKH